MFSATTSDGGSSAVTVSFVQCLKAGFAFTIGAALASGIAAVIWFYVAFPIYMRAIFGNLR